MKLRRGAKLVNGVIYTRTGRVAKHGRGAYINYGCRCKVCTEENTRRSVEYQHRTGIHRPRAEYLEAKRAGMKHGTVSMYNHAECRCVECRSESTRDRRRWRLRGRSDVLSCPECRAQVAGEQGLRTHKARAHR